MVRKLKRLALKANRHKNKIVAVGTAVLGTAQAQAALTVAPIDTADFMTVAGAVVVALGVFYGIKKALGLLR